MATQDLLARVGADVSGFTAAMADVNRSLAESARKAQSSLEGFNRFNEQIASVGARLSAVLTLPLGGFGIASLRAATDMDTLKRAMETTMGSAQKAAVEFKKLQDVAKLPGIGLEEAVRGSNRLQNLGMSADRSRRIMTELGNAIALAGGGKADFEEALRQLGQLSSVGKVTKENLDPIIERVPQIAKFMRETFGPQSIGDPAKFFEKAGISSDKFIDLMVEALSRGKRAQDGLKNSTENFAQAAQQAFATVGDSIIKAVDGQARLKDLTDTVEALTKKFGELPGSVQKAIVVLGGVTAVGPLFLVAAGQVAQGITSIVTAARTLAGLNLVNAFSAASFALANGLIPALTLGEKALLGLSVAAVSVAGAFAGWNIGKWIRDNTTLGKAIDDMWKKLEPLMNRLGLTTQKLAEQSRAEADLAFLKERSARVQAEHNAQQQKSSILSDELRGKIQALTGTHKELNAEVEKFQPRKFDEFSLQVAESTRRFQDSQNAIAMWQLQVALGTGIFADAGAAMDVFGNKLPELNAAVYENADALKKMADQMVEAARKTDVLTAAFETLGIQTAGSLKAAADKAQEAFETIRDSGIATTREVLEAERKALEARIRYYEQAGIIISQQDKDRLAQLEKDTASSTTKATKKVSEFGRQVSTIMTDLSRGIAKVIVSGGKIGDVFKKIGQDIAESILRVAIEKGIKILIQNLDVVLSKLGGIGKAIGGVFGGASGSAGGVGGSSTAPPPINAGGGGGGVAGSGASAAIGAAGSVVSAVSSVIGNFQFAHMNTALGRIEESTRYVKIWTGEQSQNLLWCAQKTVEYLGYVNASLDDMKLRLNEIAAGERGVSQLILNVDGRRLADTMIPYIGRTISVNLG